eukprot:CAMPEP_0168360330 /NCGR_PEP_ID=MMETSP0228-20121227/2107_1 /TAXON_ID=133427 /ORGANISM="Protoceratium reticulatum, Strain CCCM 535 (=CCMP 1889)" /LENGTH=459 /DNA_ID=CAMNT_0008372997 /DNA_START=6 /DNA_END=1385 /DNA_ORIENTATION=+
MSAQPRRPSVAPGASERLISTTLFLRIRPLDTQGLGGHGADPRPAEVDGTTSKATSRSPAPPRIEGWDDSSVSIKDSARKVHKFNYPTRVLVPDTSQEQAYEAMLPSLVDAWLNDCNNLMVLAYGQTGTGKTHTMFGPKYSLFGSQVQEEVHPDWGLLPRTVHACLTHIDKNKHRLNCVVTASALEFYMGNGHDLLNDHQMIEVNPDGLAQGHTMRELSSMADFALFLDDVERNRTTAATRMNTSSSRSHCCMVLTLFQLEKARREYVVTRFNLIDLAGSERAAKVGAEVPAGADLYKYMMMAWTGQGDKIPVGAQGALINMELGALTQEIMTARERYEKGMKYNPPKSCSSAFQRYTGAIMMGETLLTTIVCLSPAEQNGMENLYSLRWGEGMARLRAPNVTEKPVDVDKAYAAAVKAAEKAAKELEGAPQNRFWLGRKTKADHSALIVRIMGGLMER